MIYTPRLLSAHVQTTKNESLNCYLQLSEQDQAPIPSLAHYAVVSCSTIRLRTFMRAIPSRFSPHFARFASAFFAPKPIPQILSNGEA